MSINVIIQTFEWLLQMWQWSCCSVRIKTYADWMLSYNRLIWKNLATHLTAVHVDVTTAVCQHVLSTWLACPYTRVLTDNKALRGFRAAVYVQHMCARCNTLLTVLVCSCHIRDYIWSAYALHLISRTENIPQTPPEITACWSASVFSIHTVYVQFNSHTEIQFILLFWTESFLLLACVAHMHCRCLSWW